MDYDQLKKAIGRLEEMLQAYKDERAQRTELEQEAVQDSLVKRFEYSLELVWKSCKRHLHEEGFRQADSGSPKSIMRLAAEAGLVNSAENWINYINARQSTSHDYSGEKATQVLALVDAFLADAVALYEAMSGEHWGA